MGVLTPEQRKTIITLGEKRKGKNVKLVWGQIEDDIDDIGDSLLTLLVDCVKSICVDSAVYAAFVALFNKHNSVWVKTVIEKVFTELQLNIRSGDVIAAQMLLRFLVELTNCNAVIADQLLERLDELAKIEAKHRDLPVYLALVSLPWFSPAVVADNVDRVEGLVKTCQDYVVTREAKWKQLCSPVWGVTFLDRLEGAFVSVESLRKAEWRADMIGKSPIIVEDFQGVPQSLPRFQLESKDMPKKHIRPRLMIRRKDHVVMPLHDRYFLEDYVINTIQYFHTNVKMCAERLLNMPFNHADYERVLVDAIISELFQLPLPFAKPFFYIRLLQELCTRDEKSVSKHVEEAIRWSVHSLDTLDADTKEIVAEMVSIHTFNCNYEPHVTELLDIAKDKDREWTSLVLHKLIGLGFYAKVKELYPKMEKNGILPAEPLAINPFGASNSFYVEFHASIYSKDGGNPDRVGMIFDRLTPQGDKVDEILDILFFAFLAKGGPSPIFASKMLMVHLGVFRKIKKKCRHIFEEKLLKALFVFWQNWYLRLEHLALLFLKHELVSPLGLLNYALQCADQCKGRKALPFNMRLAMVLIKKQEAVIYAKREEGKRLAKSGKTTGDLREELFSLEAIFKESLHAVMTHLGDDAKQWVAFVRRHRAIKGALKLKETALELRPDAAADLVEIAMNL